MSAEPIAIQVSDATRISGLIQVPERPSAAYVLAHGAGAGMKHAFLTAVANGLEKRGIATLRYQFPYMEQGSKRPDPPRIAHAAVRAAVAEARRRFPRLPLFAGGKSFGGRMTSQAEAADAMGLSSLIFLGFPLHPAGNPSRTRADHLFDVHIPMLFLQGTRDALAELSLLETVCTELGARAALKLFEHADHNFHAPAKTGRKDSEILDEVLDATAAWIRNAT